MLTCVKGSGVPVFNPFMFLQRSGCALLSGQVGFLAGNLLQFQQCIDSCQRQCIKGASGPWRRVNLLLSPRWVCATEEMVVLVNAAIYMYMESDPNLWNTSTATSTATPPTKTQPSSPNLTCLGKHFVGLPVGYSHRNCISSNIHNEKPWATLSIAKSL